jgi:hypothetical protein
VSSNFKREEFYYKLFVSRAAKAIRKAFGPDGYEIAVIGMSKLLEAGTAATDRAPRTTPTTGHYGVKGGSNAKNQ